MNIKFKTKLYAGLGFLGFLVIVLWSSGLVFINILSNNSSAIIRNNNRTVYYMENMEDILTQLHLHQISPLETNTPRLSTTGLAVDSLKYQLLHNLHLQQQNITENGEARLTSQLQRHLAAYLQTIGNRPSPASKQTDGSLQQYQTIQHLISEITYLNLRAINRKNKAAQKTATDVILYMTIIGAISTLLALGLLIMYPGYVVNPIRELIDRIKKISNQNYDQRLDFNTGDEYEELANAFNTMASRLQEYESSNLAKLMYEKKRIEAIINHMSEAVVGLDKEKRILFVNARAEELIGWPKEKLVGSFAPDIAATNDFMRDLIKDITDHENQPENEEKPNLLKVEIDHKNIYYSKETIPVVTKDLKQEDEKKIGVIITLKNVTHFQEMNQAKTDFIAVVSHELKTPIASIDMSLRLLEDKRVGQLNNEQHDLIKSIKNDADRMKKTTKELLDLTRIETGNIQLNSQCVQPKDLIDYAYDTMITQAQQKNITMDIDCEATLPPVKADIQKTVWVLVNLISNAVRYTQDGGRIQLKAEKNHGLVKFSVIDNGEGISAKYLDKIFQKYFQIKNEEHSTGLGLAIAKEFINAQGGEIAVKSKVGKGSTFSFTLPQYQS